MAKLLIIAEQKDGVLKGSVAELVTAANELGGGTIGAVLGSGSKAAAAALGTYGIAEAYALDGGLPLYSSDGFAEALASVVRDGGFDTVVLMQSQFGRDCGARLAAILDAAWVSDVVGLELDGEALKCKKPLYAGKIISTIEFTGSAVKVITLRPKIFAKAEATEGTANVTDIAPPAEYKSKVTELVAKEEGQIDLKEADIIITGGRGVDSAEGFAPLRQFANSVRCALGASRAAVDAGWIDHSHQVGQTGKVVNPQLYIACGVSGAIQHMAGMQTSKYIVAINSNKNAPIFNVADYGIVGDLFEVVPELEKQILASRS